jgi:hypothetical protein
MFVWPGRATGRPAGPPAAGAAQREVIVSSSHRAPAPEEVIREIERRTARRHAILQRCFAHLSSNPCPEPWRCIAYDVSEAGVGVALPLSLPQGALLIVRAWDLPDAPPLLVRIVSVRPVESVWFTGCELLRRLSGPELRAWRSGRIDWVEGQP